MGKNLRGGELSFFKGEFSVEKFSFLGGENFPFRGKFSFFVEKFLGEDLSFSGGILRRRFFILGWIFLFLGRICSCFFGREVLGAGLIFGGV